MSEIKTRVEAKAASVKKWTDLLDRLNKLTNDIDTICGFCDLAQSKAEANEPRSFKCNVCEPDVKKLCKDYITDDRLITTPLSEAWDKMNNLLTQLRALPDVYE